MSKNGLGPIILRFDFQHNIYHVYNFYDIKHHYEARGGGKLVCGKINQFERENIVYHSLTLHVYIQHFELNHIYVHAKN